MCDCCPCQPAFKYSFFSSDFSLGRKVAAAITLTIGVALVIIFALGVKGVIPGVNAQYPILGLVIGISVSWVGGIALAGCKPRNPVLEFAEILGQLGQLNPASPQVKKPDENSPKQ